MSFAIGLVEDNSVNRATFQQKMMALGNLDFCFVAVNGNDCLAQLKGLPQNKLPQVIFMDIEMPEINGIETICLAKALHPKIHFIVLTVFDDDEKIFEAIRAGASGYLLKHEPAGVIQEAIINVMEYGGAPMSPAIARKALMLLGKSSIAESTEKNTLPEFISSREEEILKQLVMGRDAKRIATELFISVTTVRKHISNIYHKLHVKSKGEVMTMAHQNKWFEQ
jgi:DNA-binding NarL/FixJ family response regulator